MAIKYYIVPQADLETYKPKMIEALGHSNISFRQSIAGVPRGIMKFEESNLPQGFNEIGYTQEEILSELDSLDWTTTPSNGGEIII
jgi:hypothetical protein